MKQQLSLHTEQTDDSDPEGGSTEVRQRVQEEKPVSAGEFQHTDECIILLS